MNKGEYIQAAYQQIQVSGITSKPTPVEEQTALNRLNGLLLDWENKGLLLGWNVGAGDTSDDSGLPDWAYEAVITNLALKILPLYGKVATKDQRDEAGDSYQSITLNCINNMEYPDTMPVGAGNQRYGYSSRRFFVESNPTTDTQCTTDKGINL
jgi:hypothetical protein